MRDGASVNQATLNRIQFFFPKMLNIVCFFPHSRLCGQPSGDSNSSGVWKSVGPIVSQLPSKTGVERSNRPKAKILQRNSRVVKMGGLQAASGRYKISSGGCNRENRPKHCTATMRHYQILSPLSTSSWSLP